jgi:hypothetical protein
MGSLAFFTVGTGGSGIGKPPDTKSGRIVPGRHPVRGSQHEMLLRRHGILQHAHARKDSVSAVHRFAARTAHGMTTADGEAIGRIWYQGVKSASTPVPVSHSLTVAWSVGARAL